MSDMNTTNVTGVHSWLCKTAPLQLCRLTDDLGIAEECKTKPLISTDSFQFERPVVCVLGFIGFVICFDRTRALYGAGYTAARAKLEYSIFFFSLAVWFGFSVVDHCFFTVPSTSGKLFVLVDVCASLYASFAVCLAAVSEIGIALKIKFFAKKKRKILMLLVAVCTIAVMVLFQYVCPPAMEVIWVLVIVLCVGIFAILAATQFIRKWSVKLLILTVVLGAVEAAALICLFNGNSLCKKVSPHFGGEEFFFLLTDLAVYLFYKFYAWVKAPEIDRITKDVELEDGRKIKIVDEI